MGMLGDMMENMAERVVPVEVGGGAERETGPPPASEKVLRTIPEIVVGEEDLVDEANRECCVCLEEVSGARLGGVGGDGDGDMDGMGYGWDWMGWLIFVFR